MAEVKSLAAVNEGSYPSAEILIVKCSLAFAVPRYNHLLHICVSVVRTLIEGSVEVLKSNQSIVIRIQPQKCLPDRDEVPLEQSPQHLFNLLQPCLDNLDTLVILVWFYFYNWLVLDPVA